MSKPEPQSLSADRPGAFLIRFDEASRARVIEERLREGTDFSDALSTSDWPLKRLEVCGLLTEDAAISHWALARRGREFATGKVRVNFTNIVEGPVSLTEFETGLRAELRKHLVSARTGIGSRVPPKTWQSVKRRLREVDDKVLHAIEYLEGLRDESGYLVTRDGAGVVAQERDALGLSLDVFDPTFRLRKETLSPDYS